MTFNFLMTDTGVVPVPAEESEGISPPPKKSLGKGLGKARLELKPKAVSWEAGTTKLKNPVSNLITLATSAGLAAAAKRKLSELRDEVQQGGTAKPKPRQRNNGEGKVVAKVQQVVATGRARKGTRSNVHQPSSEPDASSSDDSSVIDEDSVDDRDSAEGCELDNCRG